MKLTELRQTIQEEITKVILNEETNLNEPQDSNPHKGKKYKSLRNPLGVKTGLIGTLEPRVVTRTMLGEPYTKKIWDFVVKGVGTYSDFPRKYLKQI